MATTTPTLPGTVNRVAADYTAALAARQDAATDVLKQTWKAADREIERELWTLLERREDAVRDGKKISPAWAYQEARLAAVLDTVRGESAKYATAAEATILDEQRAAAALGGQGAAALVAAGMEDFPISGGFLGVNPANVDTVVGFLADGSPVRGLFDGAGEQAAARARQALTTGMLLGRGNDRIARDLRRATGMTASRAELIARTESQRVYRAASLATYQESADVLEGWVWTAKLDRFSCPACIAMNGQVFPLTETLDGHPRCRCAMVPRTKSWADLGVPGQVDTRPPLVDGKEWLAGQPPAVQRQVLGDAKYAAYRDGKITLDDVIARTESPTWGTMRRERTMREIREGRNANVLPGVKVSKGVKLGKVKPTAPIGTAPLKAPKPVVAVGPVAPTPAASQAIKERAAVVAAKPATLTAEQYQALLPQGATWSAKRNAAAVSALESTAQGQALRNIVEEFQIGNDIPAMRKAIDARVTGKKLTKARGAEVDALLDAIREAPDWAPDTVYRGMSVQMDAADVLARYPVGGNVDMSVSSFSSSKKIATDFASDGRQGWTEIMIELVGPNKKMLPIQDLAGGKTRQYHKEKEWITTGRFRVVGTTVARNGRVTVQMEQVGAL